MLTWDVGIGVGDQVERGGCRPIGWRILSILLCWVSCQPFPFAMKHLHWRLKDPEDDIKRRDCPISTILAHTAVMDRLFPGYPRQEGVPDSKGPAESPAARPHRSQ